MINETDYKKLRDVVVSFCNSVVDNRDKSKDVGRIKPGLIEQTGLALKGVWALAAPGSHEKKAERLVSYCEANVEPLTTAFGRQALVDAMARQPGINAEYADKIEKLGGPKIASLIRNALN